MKFDYPGGVLAEERHMIETFENDVLPYTQKMGPYIGEAAMRGDADAEEIISRHRLFVEGLPEMRSKNYTLLVAALKRWDRKRMN